MSENISLERNGVSSVVKWLLFAYAFIFGIYMGGGLFETVVITPMWSASAEAARQFNQNPLSVVNSGNFFFIIAPLSVLLAVATLIVGWRTPQPIRFWLRLQIIIFLIVFVVTAIYYVPEQGSIKGAAAQSLSDTEIGVRAGRWVLLNWVRFGVAFLLWGMILHVLGLAYRQSAETRGSSIDHAI